MIVAFFCTKNIRKENMMTREQRLPKINGFIDVKKHFATSNCPIYDVVIYNNIKDYPHAGLLYSKIKFEEVKQILAGGRFKPTPLSEVLFYKKFQGEWGGQIMKFYLKIKEKIREVIETPFFPCDLDDIDFEL